MNIKCKEPEQNEQHHTFRYPTFTKLLNKIKPKVNSPKK